MNTHVSHAMRELIDERGWLTVFLLPAYSPDLNPVEWVWAHVKRSLANLAVVALDRLEALVRNRLKTSSVPARHPQGFIAGTGLTLHEPTSPRRAEVSKGKVHYGDCPDVADEPVPWN